MTKTKPKRPALYFRVVLLAVLTVLSFAASLISTNQTATAAAASTINFQARLLNSAGAIVPDGNYNVEFKLYNSCSSVASSGGCNTFSGNVWTETRTTTNRVRVVNGYLTVNLGSVNAFSGVNWDQDLWMTMNIGGTGGSPTWDGEMTPALKLTAVPYAFQAGGLANTNGANRSTLSWNTQTGSNTIYLPDESGTICIQNSINCGFMTGSASDYVQLQGSTPGTPQTGNVNISGKAIAGTSLQSPVLYGNTLDTISGTTTLNIGTSNATSGIALNQNTTIAADKTLTVQGATSVKTTTDSATGFQVMNSGNGKVFVVDTLNNFVRMVTGTVTNITTASGTGALQIGADNTDNLAIDDNEIMARTNGSASNLYLQKLGGGLNIQANSTLIKPTSNGTTTLQVQNSDALATVFNVDTTNQRVGIGTAAPSRTLNVAVNNTQTTAPMALLEQAGTGDSTLEFKNPTTSYIVGNDASDSNKFKISSSTASNGLGTLGYTSSTGSSDAGEAVRLATKFVASGSGTMSSLSVYITSIDPNGGKRGYSMAVYADNGSDRPGALLANTGTGTAAVGWNTLSLPSTSITNGTSYWITYWSNGLNNFTYWSGGTNTLCYLSAGFGSWPANFGTGTCNGNGLSIYATFTPTGSYDSFNKALLTMSDTGATTFQNSTDSTSAFQIQNAAATSIFAVDTTNGRVGINNAAPSNALDVTGDINASNSIKVGGVTVCTSSGCTASSGSNNYLKNQTSVQAANTYVQAATSGTVAAKFQANATGTGDILDLLDGSNNVVASFGSAGAALFKSANSANAFAVQNSSGASYLTIDTQGASIKIGDGVASSSIVIGDGTNNVTFAGTSREFTLNGSARHTRRITLQPEFAGAVMTAQNGCSSCSGSMTSDMDPAGGASPLSAAEGYSHSYYSWTTTQASNQNYDVWVSYTLPSDFSAFASSTPFSAWTRTSDTTNGTVTMQVMDADRSPVYCYGGASDTAQSLTPSTSNTWEEKTPATSITAGGCSFSANDRIWIRFRLQAPQNGITRLGELRFDYLSKW